MISSNGGVLMAHSPKFQSKLITREGLALLPEPIAQGPRHKPIPHTVLVEGIRREVGRRGLAVAREQYALGAKGAAIFGVLDLALIGHNPGLVPSQARGMSFGFRSSTNESLAVKAVAGTRVFVCDNLSMSGDLIAFQRKSTTGMDLGEVIANGFDKFLAQTEVLNGQIDQLQQIGISDQEAKEAIFDVFATNILPIRLFADVARFYFEPQEEWTDVAPRTRWGLHNAFTRAMKDLSPVRQFGATVALGRAFGLADAKNTIDGSVIHADRMIEGDALTDAYDTDTN